MKIEQWEIDRVKPYDKNPRRNDKAVAAVAKSIQEFGFRQPLVVDSAGVIVVGHPRERREMVALAAAGDSGFELPAAK